VTIKVAAETGLAKGVIEAAGFPTAAKIDTYGAWNATAHNVGDAGIFGLGIANISGNPGNIVLKVGDKETVISPGYYLRYYYPDAKPYCTRIDVSGSIKFSAVGSYTLEALALHQISTGWIIDDRKSFAVTVTKEEVPEPTFWEKLQKYVDEHPLSVVVGIGTVIGGALVFRNKSEK